MSSLWMILSEFPDKPYIPKSCDDVATAWWTLCTPTLIRLDTIPVWQTDRVTDEQTCKLEAHPIFAKRADHVDLVPGSGEDRQCSWWVPGAKARSPPEAESFFVHIHTKVGPNVKDLLLLAPVSKADCVSCL